MPAIKNKQKQLNKYLSLLIGRKKTQIFVTIASPLIRPPASFALRWSGAASCSPDYESSLAQWKSDHDSAKGKKDF